MFERTLLGPHQNFKYACDPGSIVEALVFYQNVRIIAHRGGLQQLVSIIGIDNFLSLLDQPHLHFILLTDNTVAVTQGHYHSFATIRTASMSQRITNDEQLISETLYRATGRRGKSRRVAPRILDKIERITASEHLIPGSNICDLAMQELTNCELNSVIPEVIRAFAPTYPLGEGCDFQIRREPQGFIVNTNIDFEQVNIGFRNTYPNIEKNINEALLLSHFFDSFSDLLISSRYDSVVTTNPVNNVFIKEKIKTLVQENSADRQLENFQREVTKNGRTIREVINSGEREFLDSFDLIESAAQFREWAGDIEEDERLMSEYIDAINAMNLIDTLPLKRLRFFVVTALGLINPAIGITAGATDAFLLDKIANGWNPSTFVNNSLDEFTQHPRAQ